MNTTFDLTTGTNSPPEEGTSKAAYTKPDEVILSETLFNDYRGSKSPWALQSQEDADYRDGAQWSRKDSTELDKIGQFPISINVIHPAVEQLKAALTANKPRFSSAGREGSDLKVGAMFADILSWIWDRSNGNLQLKQAIDDYAVRGMGLMMVYQDPYADHGKGEVCFRNYSPNDVFIDPNAKDVFCRDAGHIILSNILTHEQLQRSYPLIFQQLNVVLEEVTDTNTPITDRVGQEGQGSRNEINERTHRKYRIIDRYSRIKVSMFHVYDPQSGMEKELSSDEYMQFLQARAFSETSKNAATRYITTDAHIRDATNIYASTGGTFHYAISQSDPDQTPLMIPGQENVPADAAQGLQTIPGSTIVLTPITMKDLVSIGEIAVDQIMVDRILRVFSVGGVLYYKTVMPITDYPIIPLMNRHNRNPYPLSDVRFVKHIQEYVNKLRSLIIAHASNSTNVKLIIPRGSADKDKLLQEWQQTGTAVIEYDAEFGVPVIAGPVPLPNELYKNESDARRDIQEIFGVYTLGQGDPSSAPSTYKGTVAIDEYGQRRIKSKKDDVEEFLNQMARIIVQLVQKTYTQPKTMRIIRPNNIPLELQINHKTPETVEDRSDEVIKIGDITVGEYDVVVVSGSTLPVNRWARFEYYKELYELQIIDQVEVLKQTEVADMEGVLKRMSEIKRLRQQLAQAIEEIKGLKGDMQTLQRENVHANQKVELEKYKTDLNELSNKAQSATHLFGARLSDQIQNAKTTLAAEIKAKKASAKSKKEN